MNQTVTNGSPGRRAVCGRVGGGGTGLQSGFQAAMGVPSGVSATSVQLVFAKRETRQAWLSWWRQARTHCGCPLVRRFRIFHSHTPTPATAPVAMTAALSMGKAVLMRSPSTFS